MSISRLMRHFLHGSCRLQDISPWRYGLTNVQTYRIHNTDGSMTMWFTPPLSDKPTIAYYPGWCGGLGEPTVISRWKLLAEAGFGVAVFNPRNYGHSFKGDPINVLNDDRAFMDYLIHNLNIPAEKLYCMGYSMGTGHAAMMASEYQCAGLILQAPYTEFYKVSFIARPLQLAHFPANCHEPIKTFNGKLLVLHGERDGVVPFKYGRKIAQAAVNASVRFVVYEPSSHQNMPIPAVINHVKDFINDNLVKGDIEVLSYQSQQSQHANDHHYYHNPFSYHHRRIIKDVNDKKIAALLLAMEIKRKSLVESAGESVIQRYMPFLFNNISNSMHDSKLQRAGMINHILITMIPLLKQATQSQSHMDWEICLNAMKELKLHNDALIFQPRTISCSGISATGLLFNRLLKHIRRHLEVVEKPQSYALKF